MAGKQEVKEMNVKSEQSSIGEMVDEATILEMIRNNMSKEAYMNETTKSAIDHVLKELSSNNCLDIMDSDYIGKLDNVLSSFNHDQMKLLFIFDHARMHSLMTNWISARHNYINQIVINTKSMLEIINNKLIECAKDPNKQEEMTVYCTIRDKIMDEQVILMRIYKQYCKIEENMDLLELLDYYDGNIIDDRTISNMYAEESANNTTEALNTDERTENRT